MPVSDLRFSLDWLLKKGYCSMSSRIYSVSFLDRSLSHLVEGRLGLGLELAHGLGFGL